VGEILIRGKGKLHDRMPLPADVGEAILEHIKNGRTGNSRALFVSAKAPVSCPPAHAPTFHRLLSRQSGLRHATGPRLSRSQKHCAYGALYPHSSGTL
jgi:hypothetical protein